MVGTNHPTKQVGFDTAVAIVLTGPPASGKTTVRGLLDDLGISGIDVGTLDREGADPEWLQACLDCIERDAPSGGDTIVAIEGIRDDAEVEALESVSGITVLPVLVDAGSERERLQRYVDARTDVGSDGVIEDDHVESVVEAFHEREYEAKPYPEHAVRITNDDTLSTTTLLTRLDRLVTALEAT